MRAKLDRRTSERISIAVQALLDCQCCLESHPAATERLCVPADEIEQARNGACADATLGPMVEFRCARLSEPTSTLTPCGRVATATARSPTSLVVGLVSLNVLTGTFDLVAGLETLSGRRAGLPSMGSGRPGLRVVCGLIIVDGTRVVGGEGVLSMGAGALRLLLLALLSVGVIGMHTVGHANDHSSWDGPSSGTFNHAAGAAMVQMEGVTSWLTDAADPCDGNCGGTTPVAVRPGSASDPLPDGTGLLIVCLAVLGGLGALALLANALARRHRTPDRAASACPAGSAGAAPALVHQFSLRLVDVAVLRL